MPLRSLRLLRGRPVRGRLLATAAALLGLVAGGARVAHGNGRLPATSTITFQHGNENNVAVGLTFGLLLSHDGGKTWTWMCEAAVGYGGMYDPAYAYSSSGALFATTFNGLSVTRNGCTFDATPEGGAFVSANTIDPAGNLYFAAAQVADATHGIAQDFNIYKSTNDFTTRPAPVRVADMTDTNVWWQSISVAPSNAQVVYLSGYRYLPKSGGGTMRDALLFRSDNGGATWSPLPKTGLVAMPNSVIHIAGITSDDPAHLYARVEFVDNTTTDALYVSTDSGVSWVEIDREPNPFGAFAVRAAVNPTSHKHDLVAGTITNGAKMSIDDGKNWTPLTNAPHMGCLVESSAGELWACTQNYGVGTATSDDAGIMKTTDLSSWTKVLRYQDLIDAVSCDASTVQAMTCATSWCSVCAQLGCTPSASYACPATMTTEAPITTPPAKSGGCCEAGGSSGGPLALALSVATVLLWPRRRAPRRGSR